MLYLFIMIIYIYIHFPTEASCWISGGSTTSPSLPMGTQVSLNYLPIDSPPFCLPIVSLCFLHSASSLSRCDAHFPCLLVCLDFVSQLVSHFVFHLVFHFVSNFVSHRNSHCVSYLVPTCFPLSLSLCLKFCLLL